MVDYLVMRDVQAGGRYVLYAVLFAVAFGGSQGQPVLQGAMLVLVITGVPAYWFWTRSQHLRTHDDEPSATCTHCRARLGQQKARLERERMRDLNQRYRDRA